jgi:hypothetical protein
MAMSWTESPSCASRSRGSRAPRPGPTLRPRARPLRAAWRACGLGEPEADPSWDRLVRVNSALWEVEDALRADEAAGRFDEAFVERARSVYRLNDERARWKREVNERLQSPYVEEKSHVGPPGGDNFRPGPPGASR